MGQRATGNFPIDPDRDVFLASWPKAGRTWLRFMLAHYISAVLDLGVKVDFDSMFRLVPNDGIDFDFVGERRYGLPVFAYHADERVPRVRVTHNEWSEQKVEYRAIWLTRGMEDSVVSNYFHRRDFGPLHGEKFPATGTLSEAIRHEVFGVPAYIRHFNSWAHKAESWHVMTYERMHRDAYRELDRAVAYIGLPGDGDALEEAVEASEFSRMKQLERDNGFEGATGPVTKDTQMRTRRGEVGAYVDYFSRSDLAYVADVKVLIHPLYGELHGG